MFANFNEYCNQQQLDVFEYVPLTFVVKSDLDNDFIKFQSFYQHLEKSQEQSQNMWIIKPAEKSNQGKGISVMKDFNQIKSLINGNRQEQKCWIIQKYLENPLLYNERKFDIRMFVLVTWINGVIKVYWYQEGYVRTATKKFSSNNLDSKLVHLTNEAVQKHSSSFGKYESGNKLTLQELDVYMEELDSKNQKRTFYKDCYPKMKVINK